MDGALGENYGDCLINGTAGEMELDVYGVERQSKGGLLGRSDGIGEESIEYMEDECMRDKSTNTQHCCCSVDIDGMGTLVASSGSTSIGASWCRWSSAFVLS